MPSPAQLSDARNIYDQLVSKYAGERVVDLNRAVMQAVCEATRPQLSDVNKSVQGTLTSARSTLDDATALPSHFEQDVRGLPDKLSLSQLTSDMPTSVGRVMDGLRSATSDPTSLYPRLACGGIPVDPGKLMKIFKQYRVLDALDNNNDTTTEREMPTTSAEAITNLSTRVSTVVAPITECVSTLSSLNGKVSSTCEKLKSFHEHTTSLSSFVKLHERFASVIRHVMSVFSAGTATSDPDDETADIASRELASPSTNVVSVVERGMSELQSVRSTADEMSETSSFLETVVDAVKSVWEDIKSLLNLAMSAVKKLASALRALISSLPRFLSEVKKFFMPSGLYALVLRPSDETRALYDGFSNLQTSLPNPDDLHGKAEGLVENSPSATQATKVMDGVRSIADTPQTLSRHVTTLADDMPDQVGAAATDALKQWLRETGEDVVQDAVADVATAIGGEKLGATVSGLFGDGDDGAKPNGIGSSMMGVAGGLVGKIF